MKRLLLAASWSALCAVMALAILSALAIPERVFADGPTCADCETQCQYCQYNSDPASCYTSCLNT